MAEMTVRDAGKKGGSMTSKKYGSGFYQRIGRKGGMRRKAKLGKDGYKALGRKGGNTTLERHPEHFSKIGRLGGMAK